MKSFEKSILLLIIGGLGYGLIEIAFRGYTHWSMIITGGSAFLCLYILNEALESTHILVKSLIGAVIITTMELTVGLVVNKLFNFAVWDYTNTPVNFLGVISLPFCACWFAISYVILKSFNLIKRITSQQKFGILLRCENQLQQK